MDGGRRRDVLLPGSTGDGGRDGRERVRRVRQRQPDPARSQPVGLRHRFRVGAGGELQTYTNSTDNVYQDGGGHLVIKAIQTPDGGYTSGRIKTQSKLTMGYGRVEASIQMPPGPGILPAFWLLGSDYPSVGHPECGEIDIIEYVQSAFHFTLHGPQQGEADYRPPGADHRGVALPGSRLRPLGGIPHLLGERSPDLVTIGVDGTTTAVFTPDSLPAGATWVFNNKPMFAILNFAVGAAAVGLAHRLRGRRSHNRWSSTGSGTHRTRIDVR